MEPDQSYWKPWEPEYNPHPSGLEPDASFEYDLQNQLDHAINNGLQTTLDLNEIKDCNIVIITLGTSSDKHVIKKFNQLIDDVISKITEGSTIILRSTVTLNTINKIIEWRNLFELIPNFYIKKDEEIVSKSNNLLIILSNFEKKLSIKKLHNY